MLDKLGGTGSQDAVHAFSFPLAVGACAYQEALPEYRIEFFFDKILTIWVFCTILFEYLLSLFLLCIRQPHPKEIKCNSANPCLPTLSVQ